jgi:hypothetical protein
VPLLVRSAVVTPRPVPAVVTVPEPEQPAPQSTSATASLLPSAPRASPSPSARDSLRVAHPPPETVHSALPFVADSAVRSVAFAAAPPERPASVLLLAEPVQPRPQSTSAAATTSSEPSRSTELDVPHPDAPAHRVDPLPFPRPSDVVLASCASPSVDSRSERDPELLLSHDPPPVSHAAVAPSGVATLRCSHPLEPAHRADARDSPSAPRLDALLPQPESSHDASALDPPDSEDAPHPEDTPDRHTSRSESRSPSADSLTDPHAVNAPSDPHPAAAPSPSRSSSDTVSTCRSVASISSSVAS